MAKTIITVAPTGAFPKKEDNPAVPYTPQEIADAVYDCWRAGAAVAHLHMRDAAGEGTMDKDLFVEAVRLVRERCDIIVNCTTSGDLHSDEVTRQAHLPLVKPEMASYDCGSMNWQHSSLFLNPPKFLEQLGQTMQQYNIKPEIEVFDAGMVYNSLYYLKKGVLKAPLHYQFVMGAPGGTAATTENLAYLKSLIPADATWGAFGLGKAHVPIMLATLSMGGHLRVGFEDNIYYTKGVLAESNAQLVARAANLIRLAGNEVATPSEAAEILGVKNRPA